MSVRRVLAGVLAAMLLLPALEGSASAGPDSRPSRAPASRASLITVGPGQFLFSPNRDGRRDTARRTFRLSKPARVVARVFRAGRLVRGPVRLGALDAGRHAWRWNGRGNDRRVVNDGIYRIVFKARRGERTSRVMASARVDTTLERGTLVATRTTVYPAATQVSDQLELSYLQPGWNEAAELLLPYVFRAQLMIINARGYVVRRRTVSDVDTPRFDWFAVRNDGSPLPAGEYVARVLVYDEAGNRQVLAQPLTVSHDQLVEEVWTGPAVPASQAATFRPYFGGCLGCAACAPVASERFDAGLSFRECDFEYADTTGFFAADVPFDAAPVDSFRVTATGGPTEPGSSHTGNLDGTPTVEGDSSTTSDWQPVSLTTYPHLPGQDRPISWTFGTSEDASYDVATFAVEYRHWVPAT